MKENNSIYQRNILTLSLNNPKLSAKLNNTPSGREIRFVKSKNGYLVPAKLMGKQLLPYHSTFDPIKEGIRYFKNNPQGSFMIFIGFGAGYHIKPFLKNNGITQIIVIEKDITLLKSVLQHIDVSDILSDSRITLLADSSPKDISDFILSNYFPAISGDLQTIILQIEYRLNKSYLKELTDTIKEAINQIADDYTVQAHFGKKWFSNTLLNLPRAEESFIRLQPRKDIMITGAGPSLEEQIPIIKKERNGKLLLATDTSLPTLLKNDIFPDLVISIDCQQVSYHHFLGGIPEDIPLVVDLASPPILTRITRNTFFFTSAHPFSVYVNRNWRRFPVIDTSGGNVSHSAVSLANSLGAERIYLFGIDYSYPEGKAYARGTYIYPYFRSLENRVTPLEGKIFSFIMDNRTISRVENNGTIIYTTKPMSSYKTRLENSFGEYDFKIIQPKGKGLPLNLSFSGQAKGKKEIRQILTAGPKKSSWKVFLKKYLSKVESLPAPYNPTGTYLRHLDYEERDIWYTQFPAAAAIRETSISKDLPTDILLKTVREWTIKKVINVLENYQ